MGLFRTELHAPRRFQDQARPVDRAIGRSAKSPSPAIRATETALPDRPAQCAADGPPPAMATSTSGSSNHGQPAPRYPGPILLQLRNTSHPEAVTTTSSSMRTPVIPELPGYVVGRAM